jgi:uncharacterized RDD family membrane protein YckC
MTQYAGFWRRFVAYVIDLVILGVISAILNLILAEWLASSIGIFLGWLYFAGMESSTRQATLGPCPSVTVSETRYGSRVDRADT